MSFDPTQERHEAILHALHSIAKEFKHMADIETQALADLTAAVTAIADASAALVQALKTAAGNTPAVNNSPAIEAEAARLLQIASDMKAAIPAAPAA